MTSLRTGKVASKDGTLIAYDQRGAGPSLILVDGAFCSRAFGPMPKLAPLLAPHFDVINYDRRGRNESGNTVPYAVEREIEDIDALIGVAGGSAFLFGASSGAVLAMRAAASGLHVRKLALYEPPLVVAGSPLPVPPDRVPEIIQMVREDRLGDATKTFMIMVGMPAFMVPLMRFMPGGIWAKLTAAASTLPNDFAILGDTGANKPLPAELAEALGRVHVPMLVGLGGKSPSYMRHTAELIVKSVPGAELRVLPGQTHNVSEKALGPVLAEFFGAAQVR